MSQLILCLKGICASSRYKGSIQPEIYLSFPSQVTCPSSGYILEEAASFFLIYTKAGRRFYSSIKTQVSLSFLVQNQSYHRTPDM